MLVKQQTDNPKVHIATSYEIAAAVSGKLKALIMPAILFDGGVGEFVRLKHENKNHALVSSLFKKGDRIFLAEEWDRAIGSMGECFDFLMRREHPGWTHEWQSPEKMPHEATPYHFDVVDMRVTQGTCINSQVIFSAGLLDRSLKPISRQNPEKDDALTEKIANQIMARYDEAHQDRPFDRYAWYVLLFLEPTNQGAKT